MQPGGTSEQLFGVDAVREFNVLRDAYGAEYGKHPGGQVIDRDAFGHESIGTGSLMNFCATTLWMRPITSTWAPPPPFQRNQFGASLGGPIQKDKTFVFANYEGLPAALASDQLRLIVPDAGARNGTFAPLGSACPAAQQRACAASGRLPLLNLWPVANGRN